MSSIAIPAILAGLTGLGGLLGGNKSTQDSTTTTNPNFTPQQLSLINSILGQYGTNVANVPAFNKAYETGGVRNFLTSSINANQGATSALNSRGINRTTAGGQAVADTGYQEGNQIANFLTNAPIAEQQNTSSLLNSAGGFATSIPTGTTSTSHTTGTGNQPLSPIAGAITGGAQGVAAVLGQQNAANNLATILKSLPITNNTGFSTPQTKVSTPSTSYGTNDDFLDTSAWD